MSPFAATGSFQPSPTPVGGRFVIDRTADTPRCAVGLGYDRGDQRPVALYCPARWSPEAPSLVARWRSVEHGNVWPCRGWVQIEGRTALALDHPAADWGRPWALARRVSGARGRPSLAQIIDWAFGICEGLMALAGVGLTHGGLCPETILIVQGGWPCLAFPGLADNVADEADLTPYRLAGAPPSAAGDLYAVGGLLWFLLTGRPARGAVDGLDPDCAAVADRCLTDDPSRRYADLGALVADLSRLAASRLGRLPRKAPAGADRAAWAAAARGSVLTRLRRYEQAEDEFARAGDLAVAHVNRAWQDLVLNAPELAARNVAAALRLDPENAEARAYLGEIVSTADPAEGLAAFARAIELDPSAARAYSGRAVLRARLKEHTGAAEDLLAARELAPDDAIVHFHAAVAAEHAADVAAAAQFYRAAVAAEPTFAPARARLGRLLEEGGQPREAEQEFTRALRDDPACGTGWYHRGRLHERQGRATAALPDYTRAVEMLPWDPLPACARADLNRDLGREDDALADYAEALRRDPDCRGAHLGSAAVLQARGQHREALRHFEAVLARDPADAESLAGSAAARTELDRLAPPAAVPSLEVAAGNSQLAVGVRGTVYQIAGHFFRGEYVEAIALTHPLLRDALLPEAWQLRLQCLQRLGDQDLLQEQSSRLLRSTSDRPFEWALFRLTLGEVSAEDVLRQARDGGQMCQACYYAGMRAQFDADFDRARRWLLEAAACLHEDCVEQQLAEVALAINAPDELGSPATADLRIPFVLSPDQEQARAVVKAFARNDFARVAELVEGMDLRQKWERGEHRLRFTQEMAKRAVALAGKEPGAISLKHSLVIGRLAVISLGWLARPRDQARLAVRILALAPNRPFDRYLLHLALRTGSLDRPLCRPGRPTDEGLAAFYAAQGLPPREGDEEGIRQRGALLATAVQLAPSGSVEAALARAELRGGPPLFSGVLIPDDMPPRVRLADLEPGKTAIMLAEVQCLRVAEVCGRDSLGYAVTQNNLAHEHEATGNYQAAERLYQEALATITRVAPDSENQARCLSNLGMLYRLWHRHREADQSHRSALEIQRRVRPTSPQDIGRTLNNLGVALAELGNHREATAAFRESLELRRTYETLDLYAQTMGALGDAIHVLGAHGEGRSLMERALEIRKKTVGRRHHEIANLYTMLAMASLDMNQYDEALTYAREALSIDEETLGREHPQCAPTLGCLATAYRAKGDLAAAEEYFRRSLRTWRGAAGRTTGFGSAQLRELVLLLEAKGDHDGCWRALQELSDQEATDWLPHLVSGDTRQRLEVMKEVQGSLSCQLSVVTRTFPGRGLDLSYARVLRRKGMVGESIRWQREAVRSAGRPELIARLAELRDFRGRLARLAVAHPDELSPEEWAGRGGWEQRAADLERELTAGEADARVTALLTSLGPADLLPALGEAVLVEYVRYLEVDSQDYSQHGVAAPRGWRYLAFVLDPGPPWSVRLVPLGDAEEIDALVARFRRELAWESGSGSGLRDVGHQLRAAVFDPVRPPPGRLRVVLAPDGELNRLPFAALPVAERGWLLNDYEFSNVSCGRDLVRAPAPPPERREAVIFAGPTFDLNSPAEPSAGGGKPCAPGWEGVLFDPLESAALESDAVAKLLRPHFGTHVWTGRDAAKGRLTGLERPPQVLHLATHGFFLEEPGALSGETRPLSRGADPLTRGGIALAGAETWLQGGRLPAEMGNGLLLAAEVAELDLTGTELVVLSACQTALGEQRHGEGVFGLQRGFALAGARSLVMTLWEVEDESTCTLMEQFYAGLLRGDSRSAALRAAQLWLLRQGYQPPYWGAFVLSGDAGPLPGFSG